MPRGIFSKIGNRGIQRIQRAEVFARKSSQLRAKKEANGVEAFAYSTQETCSTGLTWPTASPFLSLSFSPRPSLSPFTLDSRKPTLGLRDTAARTQCYARCCYIASNPFVSPESLSLSLDHFPRRVQRIILRTIETIAMVRNHALHDSSIYIPPCSDD